MAQNMAREALLRTASPIWRMTTSREVYEVEVESTYVQVNLIGVDWTVWKRNIQYGYGINIVITIDWCFTTDICIDG